MIPLRYNVRNLVVRWKTTLLTAVGFMMVVALFVVMLAFVDRAERTGQDTGPVGNVIILRDGATDELFSEIATDEKTSELYANRPAPCVHCDRCSRTASRSVTKSIALPRRSCRPRARANGRTIAFCKYEASRTPNVPGWFTVSSFGPEVAGSIHRGTSASWVWALPARLGRWRSATPSNRGRRSGGRWSASRFDRFAVRLRDLGQARGCRPLLGKD